MEGKDQEISMNAVKIQQATRNDGAAISQIHYKALEKYHRFYAAFFAKNPRDIIPLATESALENSNNKSLVAVDETTKQVVGFIRYQVIEPPAEESPLGPVNNSMPSSPSLFCPKDHLVELWKSFNERSDEMDACYERAANGKRHYCKC
jgi:hypothetical protein